jgi:hypothetical protein
MSPAEYFRARAMRHNVHTGTFHVAPGTYSNLHVAFAPTSTTSLAGGGGGNGNGVATGIVPSASVASFTSDRSNASSLVILGTMSASSSGLGPGGVGAGGVSTLREFRANQAAAVGAALSVAPGAASNGPSAWQQRRRSGTETGDGETPVGIDLFAAASGAKVDWPRRMSMVDRSASLPLQALAQQGQQQHGTHAQTQGQGQGQQPHANGEPVIILAPVAATATIGASAAAFLVPPSSGAAAHTLPASGVPSVESFAFGAFTLAPRINQTASTSGASKQQHSSNRTGRAQSVLQPVAESRPGGTNDGAVSAHASSNNLSQHGEDDDDDGPGVI